MRHFHINSCLVIIIILLLFVSLIVYSVVAKAIPWWRSIMKPRVVGDEMNPEVSIGGDHFCGLPQQERAA